MSVRHRPTRRFQLDAPRTTHHLAAHQPQRDLTTIKLPTHRRRARRSFRIGPSERRRWLPWSPSAIGARIGARIGAHRRTLTLGERRRLARTGLMVGAALALLAVISGALLMIPATHDLVFPTRSRASVPDYTLSAPGSAHSANQHPLDYGASRPFLNLRPDTAAGSPAPATQASAVYLFDPLRGVILYQKDADTSYPTASLTKVMTLLLAIDSPQLDQQVTIGPDAAALVNSDNSYMGVSAGESLTTRELLYGLIVQGGNDAALAIADAIGGNEPTFVAMMNTRAQQLGLTHTHFVSPDGVDDTNVTSASDMAKLAALVVMRPDALAITSTYATVLPQTATHKRFGLSSENILLPGGASPYPGVNGVKTGYTDGAQYCMAFSAVVNGRLLVGVVLGDPSAQARLSDVRALLDWGFKQA
ncbi:MAG: D-alanyl-D-alanine carboxypeptidase family protein [Ktedonobacterales bacterium]